MFVSGENLFFLLSWGLSSVGDLEALCGGLGGGIISPINLAQAGPSGQRPPEEGACGLCEDVAPIPTELPSVLQMFSLGFNQGVGYTIGACAHPSGNAARGTPHSRGEPQCRCQEVSYRKAGAVVRGVPG